MLKVTTGGVNYEFKYEPRCRICNKGEKFTNLINFLLSSGASYNDVLRCIAYINDEFEAKEKVSYSSIRSHQINHLAYDAYSARVIQERQANRAQVDFVRGTGNILQPAAYAEVMMQKAFASLMKEGTEVKPIDGLQAAKTLHAFTQSEDGESQAVAMRAQVQLIVEAVKSCVPAHYYELVLNYISANQTEAAHGTAPSKMIITETEDDDSFDPGAMTDDD